MLRLVLIQGNEEQVFALPEREVTLGSSPENDLVVCAPGVSRRHALMQPVSGGLEIKDLGSKNGLVAEGQQIEKTVLTPGHWLQIGTAWLGIEEISASQESLALLTESLKMTALSRPFTTETFISGGEPASRSPAENALALARYITENGAGLPGARSALLLRIKDLLGAEVFATFERTRSGELFVWECTGDLSPEDMRLLASLAAEAKTASHEHVTLVRKEQMLLAGRDVWFVGAKLPLESLTREGWPKDLLRFLVHQFFSPVRSLDDVNASEAARVLALAKGNKRKAALLLGVSPGTLYKLLLLRNMPKH